MAEFGILERPAPALVFAYRESEAVAPAFSPPDPDPVPVAPAIISQPAISGGSTVGGSATLALGAASGDPAPAASWDVTLAGVSVKSQAVAAGVGIYTLPLTGAGQLLLSVSWSNLAGTVAATPATRTISAQAQPPVSMTAAPTATPQAATVGDTVTLGLGTYENAVSVVGVLMQGGVDRTAQIVDAVWSPAVAGAFTWTVTATGADWSQLTNTVNGTVAEAPAPAGVNYALADGYFGADSVISGTDSAVTGATNAGNGGWNLSAGGSGAEVTKTPAGFGFSGGKRLTAAGVSKTGLDGVFIVLRATLAAYGGSGSYIFTANPSGAVISLYDNNGTLQARYHDGTTRNIALGATPYGTEFVVGIEIDNAGNRVRVRNLAGEIVESTPLAVPAVLFNTVNMGQVVNGVVHEVALFTRPTGGAFAHSFADVIADFLAA